MIEASFRTQYGINLRESYMEWNEFTVLLAGLMPDTPLGKIIEIRSEEDKDMLKHFSPQQKEIRNNWRLKQGKEYINSLSEEETEEMINKLEAMFAKAFG